MTKFSFFIILFLSIISCGKNVCEKPILEITLMNKANSFLGGKKLAVIKDSLEIKKIDSMLSSLSKKDLVSIKHQKDNNGFIEIFFTSKECKNKQLMMLVFNKVSGDVIYYNSDNDYDYEYYDNQNLINYLKKKMNIIKKVNE